MKKMIWLPDFVLHNTKSNPINVDVQLKKQITFLFVFVLLSFDSFLLMMIENTKRTQLQPLNPLTAKRSQTNSIPSPHPPPPSPLSPLFPRSFSLTTTSLSMRREKLGKTVTKFKRSLFQFK